jgi:hypothetical protein
MHLSTLAKLFEQRPDIKQQCLDELSTGPGDIVAHWWRVGTKLASLPKYNNIITLTFMFQVEKQGQDTATRATVFLNRIVDEGIMAMDFADSLRRANLADLALKVEGK